MPVYRSKACSPDIDLGEDVIDIVSIPLLDTSNVPKIRVHRSVMKSDGWITTEKVATTHFHMSLSRYKNKNLREQICHVTGMTFNRNTKWLAEGKKLALIPIAPMIESELYSWLHTNGTPDGLPATEWSTRLLQPRLTIEEINVQN